MSIGGTCKTGGGLLGVSMGELLGVVVFGEGRNTKMVKMGLKRQREGQKGCKFAKVR
jgi:hypothetical protein